MTAAAIDFSPLQTFISLVDYLGDAHRDHLRNLHAEPKRWMRVTAPVAAALRLTTASLIRGVEIIR